MGRVSPSPSPEPCRPAHTTALSPGRHPSWRGCRPLRPGIQGVRSPQHQHSPPPGHRPPDLPWLPSDSMARDQCRPQKMCGLMGLVPSEVTVPWKSGLGRARPVQAKSTMCLIITDKPACPPLAACPGQTFQGLWVWMWGQLGPFPTPAPRGPRASPADSRRSGPATQAMPLRGEHWVAPAAAPLEGSFGEDKALAVGRLGFRLRATVLRKGEA
uniref:Uncharacterized protein n=1 Tax=Molossus molossus TaxID=27622 RepID=A0A7J8J0D3_MOLMO|nr:hypothetical protein HJG59_010361 [Molossus molossus]